MKFFKSTLSLVVLFAANSAVARVQPKGAAKKPATTTKKTTTRGKTVTTQQPVTNVEETTVMVAGPTYTEFLAKIKSMPANQVVNNTSNSLQPAFVKSVIEN